MLEKKRTLRRIEFILTDDPINAIDTINPIAFYEYNDEILDNGNVIAINNHRENVDCRIAAEEINRRLI